MNFCFSDKIDGLKPSVIREILKFTSEPGMISFAAGNPAPEAFPTKAVEEITASILSKEPIAALQYSVSEGYPKLRETLKKWISQRYSIGQPYDDLIVVSGAQQGIELSAKVLLNEGDVLLCENPSFIGSLNAFRSYNVNLEGVPMEDDGLNLEALEKAAKENPRTRILYLIPNFQNPSGTTMSLEKRKAALEIAKKYDFIILEDNPYGDLRFEGEPVPAIKSMDTEGRVIYCGSFSKILAPGLRVGYVCAHKDAISKITVAKQCSDVHTTILSQMICERFLNNYDIDRHISEIQKIYKHKCHLMIGEIEKKFHPVVRITHPQGGLFLLSTLPEGVDMMAFCQEAVRRHVAVVPGNAFNADESQPSSSFRLNYSTPTDEQIIEGISILGRLTYEMIS